MPLFEQFATNRKAEVEGIEVTFDNTTFFRIARMGRSNKRWSKLLEQKTKPYSHQIRTDTLSSELDEAITRECFIETVLLGWRGMREPEVFGTDDEVPFSQDNARKLFDALPELYLALVQQSNKVSNFRAAEVEADSKN